MLEPFFFPCEDRPVYAFYREPESRRADAPVLVACHSFGLEHAATCRMLTLVAQKAAKLGYPALLYHSRGHGDSGGDFADVTFEGMVEDAINAADQACRRSQASRVIWLGVRFGSLVAAEASIRHENSVGLALWEPVHRARDFFRQFLRGLLFAAVARGHRSGVTVDQLLERVEREGRVDLHATYLWRKFYQSAKEADLAKCLKDFVKPTLLTQIQPRLNFSADNLALARALEGGGCKITTARLTEEPGWQFWRIPWVSNALLDITGTWLDTVA